MVQDRDCVVGAWCMGWLGEDSKTGGQNDNEVEFISGALGCGWKCLEAWSCDVTPLWYEAS